jgi:hypothetical protein
MDTLGRRGERSGRHRPPRWQAASMVKDLLDLHWAFGWTSSVPERVDLTTNLRGVPLRRTHYTQRLHITHGCLPTRRSHTDVPRLIYAPVNEEISW